MERESKYTLALFLADLFFTNMSTVARRRLMRDLKKMQSDPPSGVSAAPSSADDLMTWTAVMFGPEDTPWEGGTFQLEVKFSGEKF